MASTSLLQTPSSALFLSHAPPHTLNKIEICCAKFQYANCLRPDRRTVTPYGAQRRLLSRNKIALSEAIHMPSARPVQIRSHRASASHVDHSGASTTSTTRHSASADSSGGSHVPGDDSNENINGANEPLRSLPGAHGAPTLSEPSSKTGSLPLLNASLTSPQRPQVFAKLQRAIADWWSRSDVANHGMPAILSLALVFALATSAPPSSAFIQAPPRKLQADEEHTVQLFRDNTPSVVYITNLAVR